MGCSTSGTAQVSALQSSAPRRFHVMGSSIGGNGIVSSRGGVRTTEGPLTKFTVYPRERTLMIYLHFMPSRNA